MTGNGTQAAADLISTVIGHRAQAVSFTAAPQVEVLAQAAAAHDLTAPLLDAFNSGNVVAACIGPVCAEGARAAGIEKPLVPEHPRLGSLTNALAGYLAQRHLPD
jgi:uroporphyrinogen-III synthase